MNITKYMSTRVIDNLINTFIEQVKANKIDNTTMLKIYEIYKKHKLSSDEIEWANNIADRIKHGELTKEMIIQKFTQWKETG